MSRLRFLRQVGAVALILNMSDYENVQKFYTVYFSLLRCYHKCRWETMKNLENDTLRNEPL